MAFNEQMLLMLHNILVLILIIPCIYDIYASIRICFIRQGNLIDKSSICQECGVFSNNHPPSFMDAYTSACALSPNSIYPYKYPTLRIALSLNFKIKITAYNAILIHHDDI